MANKVLYVEQDEDEDDEQPWGDSKVLVGVHSTVDKQLEIQKLQNDKGLYLGIPELADLGESHQKTFQKGLDYFLGNFVLNVKTKNGELSGKVKGEEDESYSVTVKIENNHIVSHTCTCLAHGTYPGPCKHVVALIYAANSKKLLY
jgi:hypothetical protein